MSEHAIAREADTPPRAAGQAVTVGKIVLAKPGARAKHELVVTRRTLEGQPARLRLELHRSGWATGFLVNLSTDRVRQLIALLSEGLRRMEAPPPTSANKESDHDG